MANPPKVFLDTNVFKFSTTEQVRLVPRRTKVDWGPKSFELDLHDFKTLNPNDKIRNAELKAETNLLEKVAEAVKRGSCTAVTHFEVVSETWGLPGMDTRTGRFYRAPIGSVVGPIRYSRPVFSPFHNEEELLRQVLENIAHPRFDELQRITGAYQGANKKNLNQLLDAFYVWCAEFEACDYFLTLDFKLIRLVSKSAKRPKILKLVTPSVLLNALGP